MSFVRPATTYLQWLSSHARHRMGVVAVVDDGVAVSYAALERAYLHVAAELADAGVRRGDVVALAMEPSAAYLAVLLGTLRAGGVAAPINTRLAPPEVQRYLQQLEPHTVLHDDESAEDRATVGFRAKLVDVGSVWGGDRSDRTPVELPELNDADPAVIFPTGGTTGLPKGAYNDHKGLALWTWNVVTSSQREPTDIELFFSPFFHVTLVVGVLAPLMAGGTVVIQPRFEPASAVRTIREHRITHLMGAPTMFEALMDEVNGRDDGFESVRRVTFGSSASTPRFVERLCSTFPRAVLATGYGATEFASGVTRVSDGEIRAGRRDGVGRPVAGVEMEIRTVDGHHSSDGSGEIFVRSPWNTLGYWNDAEATAATYGPDGFIRLGDLGRFTDDGWLVLEGRLKEMIVTGGENVFPAEVEAALADIDGVEQVVAFGVADDYWGERVEAAVRLASGAVLEDEAWRSQLRTRLAGYKIPHRLHVVDVIPLTPNNKPDRVALRQKHG